MKNNLNKNLNSTNFIKENNYNMNLFNSSVSRINTNSFSESLNNFNFYNDDSDSDQNYEYWSGRIFSDFSKVESKKNWYIFIFNIKL